MGEKKEEIPTLILLFRFLTNFFLSLFSILACSISGVKKKKFALRKKIQIFAGIIFSLPLLEILLFFGNWKIQGESVARCKSTKNNLFNFYFISKNSSNASVPSLECESLCVRFRNFTQFFRFFYCGSSGIFTVSYFGLTRRNDFTSKIK